MLYERDRHTITMEYLALQTSAFLAEAMAALFFALPTTETAFPRKGEHHKKCSGFAV